GRRPDALARPARRSGRQCADLRAVHHLAGDRSLHRTHARRRAAAPRAALARCLRCAARSRRESADHHHGRARRRGVAVRRQRVSSEYAGVRPRPRHGEGRFRLQRAARRQCRGVGVRRFCARRQRLAAADGEVGDHLRHSLVPHDDRVCVLEKLSAFPGAALHGRRAEPVVLFHRADHRAARSAAGFARPADRPFFHVRLRPARLQRFDHRRDRRPDRHSLVAGAELADSARHHRRAAVVFLPRAANLARARDGCAVPQPAIPSNSSADDGSVASPGEIRYCPRLILTSAETPLAKPDDFIARAERKKTIAFAALHHKDFRAYFVATMLAMMADNIEHVISYWLLYEKFHSPVLAGFAVLSHWTPFLLFAVYFGALADRFDCRKVIQVAQIMYMGVSAAWAVLFFTGTIQVWHACVLLVIHGMAGVLWGPGSQLLIHDIVGPEQ